MDVNNFVLMPVDQTVPSDPATQKQINEQKHIKSYLEVSDTKIIPKLLDTHLIILPMSILLIVV